MVRGFHVPMSRSRVPKCEQGALPRMKKPAVCGILVSPRALIQLWMHNEEYDISGRMVTATAGHLFKNHNAI
jgi:hypothetical protein